MERLPANAPAEPPRLILSGLPEDVDPAAIWAHFVANTRGWVKPDHVVLIRPS